MLFSESCITFDLLTSMNILIILCLDYKGEPAEILSNVMLMLSMVHTFDISVIIRTYASTVSTSQSTEFIVLP